MVLSSLCSEVEVDFGQCRYTVPSPVGDVTGTREGVGVVTSSLKMIPAE